MTVQNVKKLCEVSIYIYICRKVTLKIHILHKARKIKGLRKRTVQNGYT